MSDKEIPFPFKFAADLFRSLCQVAAIPTIRGCANTIAERVKDIKWGSFAAILEG